MSKLRAGIHRRLDDGSYALLAGFEWDGGEVRIIAGQNSPLVENIGVWGIPGFDRDYMLKEGEAFMRQIPWAYQCSTGYGDLWEEKDGKWVKSPAAPPPNQQSKEGETNA